MGRKKSRNASTSGSSSHNRSQADLRHKGSRSNSVHKFSRTSKVSRTKTKVSKSVRRRREKLEEETASIIQQLDVFMEALENEECSECTEDEDKTLTDNWGEARGSANFLKEKDVPVDSLDKVEALIELNDRYGFDQMRNWRP